MCEVCGGFQQDFNQSFLMVFRGEGVNTRRKIKVDKQPLEEQWSMNEGCCPPAGDLAANSVV